MKYTWLINHLYASPGEIESWCSRRTLPEVVEVMKKARVPSGPILSMKDIVSDPQFNARGMMQKARKLDTMTGLPQSVSGPDAAGSEDPKFYTVPALMPVLSETPGGTRWAGPELGQHTDLVLKEELGFTSEKIDSLRKIGAIA